ncbi:nuclear transport factor 2 family protein [Parafrigoribacterium soli]|uniref:hypothetical protein n=1 Tax=Parafrigoribacterium soli TaxID=3144663 RepID=UPI0032ED51CC
MTATAARFPRTLIVILSVIGALVILALAVVFTRGEPTQLDESTPAGVVQRYSAAVIAGDEAAAADYLTEGVRAECTRFEQFGAGNLAVRLVSTKERVDSADVTVSIASSTGNGPFGSAESEYEDVFGLVKTDNTWRIESVPWQLTVCTNAGQK